MQRWTYIDQLEQVNRPYLNTKDCCFYYFLRDNRGYNDGSNAIGNSIISNFKREPSKIQADRRQAYYKQKAIQELSERVVYFFNQQAKTLHEYDVCLVPIPTSKPRTDINHDSRMDDLCKTVSGRFSWVRFAPILETKTHLGTTHYGEIRRNPLTLMDNIKCENLSPTAKPLVIVLIDDVLVTGSHFAACRDILNQKYPDVLVIGLFLSIHVSAR